MKAQLFAATGGVVPGGEIDPNGQILPQPAAAPEHRSLDGQRLQLRAERAAFPEQSPVARAGGRFSDNTKLFFRSNFQAERALPVGLWWRNGNRCRT